MKKPYLILVSISTFGCLRTDENLHILSFQNKWGVAFCEYPRPGGDCRYNIFFLPLKNLADSNTIADSSSIFKFQYDKGINFRSDKTIIDQIRSANPKEYIFEKGNNHHIYYWAFMKIRYHLDTAIVAPKSRDFSNDTVLKKNTRFIVSILSAVG